MTVDQARNFVDARLRPQGERGRAFLTLAANDAANFDLGYGDYFAPVGIPADSAYTDVRTDVPHQVSAADVIAFMGLLDRVNAVITPDDRVLIEKFCVRKLEVA